MSKKPIFCVDAKMASDLVGHDKAHSNTIGHNLNEGHSYYTLLLANSGDEECLCEYPESVHPYYAHASHLVGTQYIYTE